MTVGDIIKECSKQEICDACLVKGVCMKLKDLLGLRVGVKLKDYPERSTLYELGKILLSKEDVEVTPTKVTEDLTDRVVRKMILTIPSATAEVGVEESIKGKKEVIDKVMELRKLIFQNMEEFVLGDNLINALKEKGQDYLVKVMDDFLRDIMSMVGTVTQTLMITLPKDIQQDIIDNLKPMNFNEELNKTKDILDEYWKEEENEGDNNAT